MSNIWTTVIVAMSVDGKIANSERQVTRFTSQEDFAHLERQVALNDAIIFGAGTLRVEKSAFSISNTQLLQARQERKQPPQPLQIVCSSRANFNPDWRFFSQSAPRGLLTTSEGAKCYNNSTQNLFDYVFIADSKKNNGQIDWQNAFQQLTNLGYYKIAILGGGNLIASLFAEDLINELWLTICPTIIGGKNAPTPVDGKSLFPFKSLQLKEVKQVNQEIFLNYLIIPNLGDRPA